MNIRHLFYLRYDPCSYHCVHFVIDAAKHIFGVDYTHSFVGLTGSLDDTLKTSRATATKNKRLNKPREGCIVLMTYPTGSSHCGLFFRQRILHLTERGVQRITIDQAKPYFSRIRFYEPHL